jgi:hypothetical protein
LPKIRINRTIVFKAKLLCLNVDCKLNRNKKVTIALNIIIQMLNEKKKNRWTLITCRGMNLRNLTFAARLSATNDAIGTVDKGGVVRSANRFT